jgi:DNA modification methylase
MSSELHHGDCLEVMNTLAYRSVDMVLCDLPYGVTARNPWDAVLDWKLLWAAYGQVCKETTPIVLTATQPFASACVMSKPEWFKYEWIWEKEYGTGFLNAKKQPLRSHEQILVFYQSQCLYVPQMEKGKPYTCKQGGHGTNYHDRGTETHEVITVNEGTRCPKTVLKFGRDKEKVHPTQKPVALLEYMIRTYTREGDTVLDNTMGSGSTGVACANLGRNFIGIEKDLEYFKIAQQRIGSVSEQVLVGCEFD